jgi:FkbM family methyltransferase
MALITKMKLRKVWFSARHPRCWKPLMRGVAPTLEHLDVIRGIACDRLIDVGANRGQFSLLFRVLHPTTPIDAFEPLPGEAAVYRAVFSGDARTVLHPCALGETAGTATLHVSRKADSSSLLPIGELQSSLFPDTDEVGVQTVPVSTLDAEEAVWSSSREALLKLDVQGFEMSVLKGARRALRHCRHVYAECSTLALYQGQALYPEVEAFLRAEGFAVRQRVNDQMSEGGLVQADYLFTRIG